MKHTLVVLMQNQPGVLNRVVGLALRRNFHFRSFSVGPSEAPDIVRMTLVVDSVDVEQVIKQLYRLIEVLKVSDVTHDAIVEREIVLLKVRAPRASRAELVAIASVYSARVVDVDATSMMIEMIGAPSEVDRLLDMVRPFGIREMVRTGHIAMVRGDRTQQGFSDPDILEDARPSHALAVAS